MKELTINNSAASKTKKKKISLYRKVVIELLRKMQKGYLQITLPEGDVINIGEKDQDINAYINIKDNSFFKKVVKFGDVGFGESYVDGDWETNNITNVISWMILNIESNPAISGSKVKFSPISLLKTFNTITHKFNHNSVIGSKKNISAHYDLNNDFFKLFLDDSMTYSSGIFAEEDTPLGDAQIEKYDRICRELKLKEDDHILEIGSGWGSFAFYAAFFYKCKVTSITISEEQFKYANDKLAKTKLKKRVEFKLIDYRKMEGQFDKIVSIEMLEAVGHKYYKDFFAKCNQLLKKDGAMSLQVITSHDSRYNELRKGVDWIQKHIFPGSLLPSIGILNKTANETSNMHIHDIKNFGLDYGKTLNLWRQKFNKKLEDVKLLGFDDYFVRKWNYYLSYCEAAFNMRNISVIQVVYTRPNNRNL
ncbi:MAG: class I SAM-dependent methyltransferase [Melioribacteraceae bacterium]|nr:class I SAM-dependent methyltransferase [Melioribacteraceae bacterium]